MSTTCRIDHTMRFNHCRVKSPPACWRSHETFHLVVHQTHLESCRSMVPVLECRTHRRLVAVVRGVAMYARTVVTINSTTSA